MESLVAALRSCLDGHPEVVAAWLFGSHAKGTARAGSDVDVAVLLDRPRARSLDELPVELHGDLESAVSGPVDLVVLDGADSDLVHRVLRDGVLLVERDRAARIRFEVRKRNEYFDMEHVRRLVRRLPGRP